MLTWITLYGKLEAGANAVGTVQHNARDLKLFYNFFREHVGIDEPDQWTKPNTAGFLRYLEKTKQEKPTTINRRLATLKHCASWIDRHRPFLAGHPCEGRP